ncbi:MAG: HutD family protein [Burkholderiales bacterium]|nr:HutD family protein [Burkholderiales bacterium]
MSLQVIEARRITPHPWPNKVGTSRELFRWPAEGEWQMRISLAEVAHDGQFSAYPGVDRWFVVVGGAGVVLHLDDGRHMLDNRSPPLAFDGAKAPHFSLQDRTATQDLNLMLRRGAGRAAMQRVQGDDEWISTASLRAVYAAEPMILQVDEADAARLPAHALAISQHAGRQRWRVRAESDTPLAWWLGFEPAPTR